MEKLYNGYVKIQPVVHKSFIVSEKESYNELGIVLAKDEDFTESARLKIGSTVRFDSWMAKKFPIEGQEGVFGWYIHFSQIVSEDVA